jgi:hypothetical protein
MDEYQKLRVYRDDSGRMVVTFANLNKELVIPAEHVVGTIDLGTYGKNPLPGEVPAQLVPLIQGIALIGQGMNGAANLVHAVEELLSHVATELAKILAK